MTGLLDFTIPNGTAGPQTPEQAAYLQQMAQQLMQEGTSSAPIRSPWQGAANLGKAILGNYDMNQAVGAQNTGRKSVADALVAALGGAPAAPTQLQGAGAPTPYGAATPGAPPPTSPLAAALGARAAVTPSATPAGPANNPGNLVDNSWTRTLPGYVGPHGRFASFDSPADGVAAMAQNLSSYARQGVSTLAGLTSKWAPAGDGANDPAAYAATLAHGLGVDPNAPINLADPAVQQRLIPLMARVEQGPGAAPVAMAQPSPALGAGASPPGGPQGAGAPPPVAAPAPSQADIGALRTAMQPAAPPSTGFGLISPAEAAPAQPQIDPRLMAASGLSASLPPAAPAPAAPSAPGAPMRLPGAAQGLDTATAPGPAPAMGAPPMAQPSAGPAPAAPGGFHPDPAALLRVLQNPWATPQQQQIAMALLQTQMPTPPTWGVISKGADGSEHYGWISPKTQSVTPGPDMGDGYNITSSPGGPAAAAPSPAASPGAAAAPVTPGSAPVAQPAPGDGAKIPNLPPIGATPEGVAWLNGVAAQGGNGATVARRALAIIEGKAQLPDGSGTGPTKAFDIAVSDAVFKAAPGYSATLAASRSDAIKQFQAKSSPQSRGGLVQNMNAAVGHLADLSDLSEKLPTNSNSTMLPNSVVNQGKALLSQGPNAATLSAYKAAVGIVSQELTKFYEGAAGSEADRQAIIDHLSPDASPAERRSAIAAISKLIQTKGTEIQRDWHQATGAPSDPQYDYPIYGPEALDGMAKIAQRGSPNFNPSAGATPAAAPKAPPAIGDVIKGHRFRGGDPSQQSSWDPVA